MLDEGTDSYNQQAKLQLTQSGRWSVRQTIDEAKSIIMQHELVGNRTGEGKMIQSEVGASKEGKRKVKTLRPILKDHGRGRSRQHHRELTW